MATKRYSVVIGLRREKVRLLFIASAAVFAVVSTFLGNAVYAGSLTYDPESCASDPKGKIFVALGRIVLSLPSEELTYIGDWPPEKLVTLPSAPNPSEPEGCPGNPVQGHDLAFLYIDESIHEQDSRATPQKGMPDRLKLVAADLDDVGLQPLAERRFYEICERHGESEELSNGLIACRVPPVHKMERNHWAASYMAPPYVYTAPFGRPFVIWCYPGFASRFQQCSVGYKLNYGLNVSDRFDVRKIPIDKIIEFDRNLRARIESARIAAFTWPDS